MDAKNICSKLLDDVDRTTSSMNDDVIFSAKKRIYYSCGEIVERKEHISNSIINNIKPIKMSGSQKRRVKLNGDNTRETKGWVLQSPIEIKAYFEDGKVEASTKNKDHLLNQVTRRIYELNTNIYVSGKDDISILMMKPDFYDDNKFDIVPTVLDLGSFPQALTIFIKLNAGNRPVRVRAGDPLLHIYPIHKLDTNINAELEVK